MLSAIVRWSLQRKLMVAAAAMLLLIYGVFSLTRAKFDVFPDFVPAQTAADYPSAKGDASHASLEAGVSAFLAKRLNPDG